MEIEIYLSTDGKHTVHVKAEDNLIAHALIEATNVYDQIVKKYGLKPVTSFTKPKEPVDPNSPLYCKVHQVMMKDRQNGYPPSHVRKLGDTWDGCQGKGYKSEKEELF